MTNAQEVYFCKICGNEVRVITPGKGQLVCCGEPMKLKEKKYTRSVDNFSF